METILAPPFAWQWNRSSITFNTVIGQSDYSQSLPTFGWLERATIYNSTLEPPTYELEIKTAISADGDNIRPAYICPLLDDNAGNITFRIFPIPDLVYTVTLMFQKAPLLASSLSGTWAPIPDKFQFMYSRGLLAQLHAMYSMQMYLQEMDMFWRQLVGAAEGLSESQKAIFLEDKLRTLRTQAAELQALSASPKRR